jgi:hypothetical protein
MHADLPRFSPQFVTSMHPSGRALKLCTPVKCKHMRSPNYTWDVVCNHGSCLEIKCLPWGCVWREHNAHRCGGFVLQWGFALYFMPQQELPLGPLTSQKAYVLPLCPCNLKMCLSLHLCKPHGCAKHHLQLLRQDLVTTKCPLPQEI